MSDLTKDASLDLVEAKAESFESLYKAYYLKVAGIVYGYRFYDGAADDLIQDIFFQAWRYRDTLKQNSSFGAWIKVIARNRCLNEIRKQRPTVSIDAFDGEKDSISLEADDYSKSYHFEFSLSLLRDLVSDHKKEPQATVAKLFYLDHMSVKDIAEKLSMPDNTVLSHLRRFRLAISKAMLRLVEEHNLDLSSL
jgi:RNA polymerase sigma-70 factor (ECF subfamily)